MKLITQPPPSVDITNERSYTSNPPYAFLGCTETKLPLQWVLISSYFTYQKDSCANLSDSKPLNIWSSQLLRLMVSTPGVVNYFVTRPDFISRKLRERDL